MKPLLTLAAVSVAHHTRPRRPPSRGRPIILPRFLLLCGVLCAAVVACSENISPAPPVTVASVSPTNGPLAGGTAVTITGTNFLNVTGATVGGGALQNLSVVSSTQITGLTPASASSGAKDVVVSSSSNGGGTCTGCFTYNPAVTVTGVSPTSGPVASATAVTITGTNFLNVTGVTVGGGALQNLSVVSSTQITGLTPASVSGGAKDVVVKSSSNGGGTCTGCFTYVVSWTSLAAGHYHTCGATRGGAAYCWGAWPDLLGTTATMGQCIPPSLYGEVVPCSAVPVVVAGGLTFENLTAGQDHTCGLTTGGAAYCWGNNQYGALGDGSTTSRLTPVAVAGGLTFASLTAGGLHTCGLTSGGEAYCWGNNSFGALGDSSTTDRHTPVAVAGGLTFASLTAGGYQTCGVTSSGAAYCWGKNQFGELGDGSTTTRPTPVAVAAGLTFSSLTAGDFHTCGLTSGGAAYCWGDNSLGQLGTTATMGQCTRQYVGPCSAVPVAVAGGLTFASLTAGYDDTCGLTSSGTAYCWGENGSGELGDGSTTTRITPGPVAGGLTFGSLAAGGGHTCGVTSGRAAYCWGDNSYAALGDGSTTNRPTPVAVASP